MQEWLVPRLQPVDTLPDTTAWVRCENDFQEAIDWPCRRAAIRRPFYLPRCKLSFEPVHLCLRTMEGGGSIRFDLL